MGTRWSEKRGSGLTDLLPTGLIYDRKKSSKRIERKGGETNAEKGGAGRNPPGGAQFEDRRGKGHGDEVARMRAVRQRRVPGGEALRP